MGTLIQDLRYGVRVLTKKPSFAAIAVLTLALGIGANTAIFSVVHGVLIKPMPYVNPEELVDVYWSVPSDPKWPFSFPDFLDVQAQNRSFSEMAAYVYENFSVLNEGEPERVEGEMVSAQFFRMLNIQPIVGRTFFENEDKLGGARVAVIGDDLWSRRFNSSTDIVGRSLNLDGKIYTIVGVVSARLPFFEPLVVNVFTPINQYADPAFRDRKVHMGTYASGRLKREVSLAQARTDMDRISRDLAAAYPEEDAKAQVNLVPIKEDTVGDMRVMLLTLMGAVGFVLLIACANVASLLLVRSSARGREFAIRCALGADQFRMIRQLLTESILLSVAGAVLGALIAHWGTEVVLANVPKYFQRRGEIRLDLPVLLFALAIAVLTGVLCGLAPALRTRRADLCDSLKAAGHGSIGIGHRIQAVFTVGELALAIVLLAGAGLMIRTMAKIWTVDPGFNPHNVLTFALNFSADQRSSLSTTRRALRDETTYIESMPGIVAASAVGGALPVGNAAQMPFWIEGRSKPTSQNEMSSGIWYAVQPDYLKAMGIPLLRGRFVSAADTEVSPSIVVIDENLAREFFPNEDPIGKQINTELMGPLRSQIVGIVGHAKQQGPSDTERQDREGQFYFAIGQLPDRVVGLFTGMEIVARTSGDPLASVASIRAASGKFDANQVLFDFKSMDELLSESIANHRFAMILLIIFAALALVLSAIGVYGVISFLVTQRTREIGVRVALGAQRSDLFRLILGEGARLIFLGVAIGLAASLGLTRLLAKMLFGVRATDPLTLAAVTVVLTGVALLACYVPARRAMRLDPMVALRYE